MAFDPNDPSTALPNPEIFTIFFDHGPERAQGITYAALIDELLEKMLRAALRQDAKMANEFFSPSGILGTYGAKVRLLYMLGIVGSHTYLDLNTIQKIRNKFAHDINIKSFDQNPVKD